MRRMDRAQAATRYAELPMPSTTDEHWRFTDLKGFDPESFVRNGHVPGSDRKSGLPETMLDVDTAGLAVVREGGVSIVRSPDERITFEPFTDHERLGGLVGTDEKFAAHNAAVWEHGLLVVVPRGVELEQPLAVQIVNATAGGFGSRRGKVWIQNDLTGPGATSRVTGAYFADGDQHLDYDTYQLHSAPNTTSDFAFKGALRDKATAVWRGMIRVEKDAQRTNAYQENRNLMLSPTTHAVPIPGLEILANDVRCTHGATVGQVDRDQLFYLMARGLSRGEAERLIVRG